MDGKDALTNLVTKQLHRKSGFMPVNGTAVSKKPWRLVNRDDVIIGVDHFEVLMGHSSRVQDAISPFSFLILPVSIRHPQRKNQCGP